MQDVVHFHGTYRYATRENLEQVRLARDLHDDVEEIVDQRGARRELGLRMRVEGRLCIGHKAVARTAA